MLRTASLLVLCMALTASSVHAQDQLPGSPVQPTVEVTLEAVTRDASFDEPASYTVTLRNTSPGSETGQDPLMTVTLSASADTAGWITSLEESNFQLRSGEETETTLLVTVTGSATRDAATITVTATIRNGSPPLEETGTDSESVDILRQDSARRAVTETIGDYIWIIIAGGVGVYLLSMVLLVAIFRRRAAASETETEPDQDTS